MTGPTRLQPKPNEGVISLLKELLRDAEAGDINGIVVLCDRNGEVSNASDGDFHGPNVIWAFILWAHRLVHNKQRDSL